MRHCIAPALLTSLGLILTPPAAAQSAEDRKSLAECLDLLARDPSAAYERGIAWMSFGAPPEARYCTALALVELGQPHEGAARLEALASDRDAGDLERRGVILAQAGNAWLLAGAPEAALVTLSNAVRLRPRDGALRTDRARAYILLDQWSEAGRELDAAIELSVGNWEAHYLRAVALRRAGRLEDAWQDIEAARTFAPDNADVLVLRGQIAEARALASGPSR